MTRDRDQGRTNRSAFEASRMNAFSFDPDDLVLIEDPKHPLYDARVKNTLPANLIANIRAVGITTPVVIRKMDYDGREGVPVVIDGRHRVRIARLLNATAVEDGRDTILVPAVVRRGDAVDAYTVTCSANLHAPDDKARELALKAQRLAQLGRTDADVAVALGISLATAKKYLESTPKAKEARKPRGPSKRPKTSEVARVAKEANGHLTQREHALLDWALGTVTREGLLESIPGLAEILG